MAKKIKKDRIINAKHLAALLNGDDLTGCLSSYTGYDLAYSTSRERWALNQIKSKLNKEGVHVRKKKT